MRSSCHRLARVVLALVLAVTLLAGCGNAAQREAFEQAERAGQQVTAQTLDSVVAAYRHVIALEPGSDLAKKAEERLRAIEARKKADEAHKAVFQEHGVD
jgi:hypothetical protein